MEYPTYLIHYNKNHSKANGQFVSGDGDGDGIANDHAHRSESGRSLPSRASARRSRNGGIAMLGVGAGLGVVSKASHEIGEISGSVVASGVSMVTGCASVPLAVIGTVRTITGAVNMGKASRRGDES